MYANQALSILLNSESPCKFTFVIGTLYHWTAWWGNRAGRRPSLLPTKRGRSKTCCPVSVQQTQQEKETGKVRIPLLDKSVW